MLSYQHRTNNPGPFLLYTLDSTNNLCPFLHSDLRTISIYLSDQCH